MTDAYERGIPTVELEEWTASDDWKDQKNRHLDSFSPGSGDL